MRSNFMKSMCRAVAGLLLTGVVVVMALFVRAEWRIATRPKATGWSVETIHSRISAGMTRAEVLHLLGPPHTQFGTDGCTYYNAYGSRESRHLSRQPSQFSIFFKNEKVEMCISDHDY